MSSTIFSFVCMLCVICGIVLTMSAKNNRVKIGWLIISFGMLLNGVSCVLKADLIMAIINFILTIFGLAIWKFGSDDEEKIKKDFYEKN